MQNSTQLLILTRLKPYDLQNVSMCAILVWTLTDVMLPQEQKLVGISQVCCSSQSNKWFSLYHGTRDAKRLVHFLSLDPNTLSTSIIHTVKSCRCFVLRSFCFFLLLLWNIVQVTPEACCLHLKRVSWQAPHLACSRTQTHPAQDKETQSIPDNKG